MKAALGVASFLMACTSVGAVVSAQVEEPDTHGSWMKLDPAAWPHITMVNQIDYAEKHHPVAGCGFLLDTGDEIVAATAKHVLTYFKSEAMDSVDFEGTLKRWKMFPKDSPTDVVVVDELINRNPRESVAKIPCKDDWLLFTVESASKNIQPLRLRSTPLRSGEKVFVVGWRYPDEGAQRVLEGKYVRSENGSVLISVEVLADNTIPGLSGSPVLDARGHVIGLMSMKAGKLQRLSSVDYPTKILQERAGSGSQADGPQFEVLPPDLVARAVALRERALAESQAYDFLAALTTEIGPRPAGSDNDRRAVEWARRRFEALGFSNVRTEEVVVPCWQRGEASGELTAPHRQPFAPAALGGSVATPEGGIEAEVVRVAGLEELAQLERSQVEGKIVFVDRRMRRTRDGSGYGEVAPIRRFGAVRAAALGAVAVLNRSVATSGSRVAHTGMMHYQEGVPRIPAAALSNPDADMLAAWIRRGEAVRFRLELGCRVLPDTTSANVIGEIPGRERPEEVVLLVAHLDSWDLGTGTLDDGAGCAIITEVARLIGELEPAPRRTVRVWLAANEEFGLSGGLAYRERYADAADLHVAAMEADLGAARVWGLRTSLAPEALPAARDLGLLLAPLGIEYLDNNTLGGADLLPMLHYQIPLLELRQDATDYFDHYHSAGDTLDKVDPENLAQNVAAFAVAALVAAEYESGLGRAPRFRGQLPPPFDEFLKER